MRERNMRDSKDALFISLSAGCRAGLREREVTETKSIKKQATPILGRPKTDGNRVAANKE